MDLLSQTYLADILHIIAQALLIPTIVLLIALILYGLWCIGSIIAETILEHRHFKIVMPAFLDDIDNATSEQLPQVIKDSGLLGKQKRALLTLWDYRCLPVDAHVALAKRLLAEIEDEHTKKLSRTQTVSKIAPMLGLMGTLIPLGPGLVSLGVGDTLTLSSSLLVAFDTTVAGLVVALVTYVITKIRSRWYENYMNALETGATALLEKVDTAREAGTLGVDAPTNFAGEYSKRGRKKSSASKKGGKASSSKGNKGSKASSAKDAKDASSSKDASSVKDANNSKDAVSTPNHSQPAEG